MLLAPPAPIAILGAMPEEVDDLLTHLANPVTHTLAGRTFVQGDLWGRPVVIAFSRWGKVAAALTATLAITHFKPEALLFVGVAGALDATAAPQPLPRPLDIADIVIARHLFQHDLDASPLFPPMQIPLTSHTSLPADPHWSARLLAAAHATLTHDLSTLLSDADRAAFGLTTRTPLAIAGDIVTGDQFICSAHGRARLHGLVPSALACDMESAAVAQVAADFAVPLAVLRILSDRADAHAPANFSRFIQNIAKRLASHCLRRALTAT